MILHAVLGLDMNEDEIPVQEREPSVFKTVIEAHSVKVADGFTAIESDGN